MLKKLITLLLLSGSVCSAQPARLSRYELRWALAHPFTALKVKKIGNQCRSIANRTDFLKAELDSFSNGGRLDAYRHVFFMAAFAQKVKTKKIRKLGKAHERANYRQFLRSEKEEGELPDSLASVMDLKNNEVGFKLGCENKQLTLVQLSELVITEIRAGKAFIMKRDPKGNYLDCEEQLIVTERYRHVWVIPKCLISSKASK